MKYITYGFNAHHEHKNHFGIIHLHVVAHVVFQGFINSAYLNIIVSHILKTDCKD
jgi:hypothetical protein